VFDYGYGDTCITANEVVLLGERVRRTSSGEPSGGNRCIGGNQVWKEGGNQYLDMVSAIESEVAELHSSTATGAPL